MGGPLSVQVSAQLQTRWMNRGGRTLPTSTCVTWRKPSGGTALGKILKLIFGGKRGVLGRDRGNGWEVAIMLQNAAWILWLCGSSKLEVVFFLWRNTQPYTQTENHPAAEA